jgi:hypothetical protein
LIPIYLSAVVTYARTWRLLAVGVLGTAPIFVLLGIMRLLVVAVPAVVATPLVMVHAFYQLLLGGVVVFVAALWRHGGMRGVRHGLAGLTLAGLFGWAVAPWIVRFVTYPVSAPLDDPQGALALLPPFQFALYVALWVAAFAAAGWWRFLAGFGALALTQTAVLLTIQALNTHAGLSAHVRDIRGWAVVGPLLIVAAVVNGARPHR